MPLYDFKCDFCHGTFELFFPMNDKPVGTACRLCGTLKIQAWPVISAPKAIKIDQGRLYSVAFGREFKNEKDMNDYAKFNNCIPIENTPVETIHKLEAQHHENERKKMYQSLQEDLTWAEYNG